MLRFRLRVVTITLALSLSLLNIYGEEKPITIIPTPNSIEIFSGVTNLNSFNVIFDNIEAKEMEPWNSLSKYITQDLKSRFSLKKSTKGDVELHLKKVPDFEKEQYRLTIEGQSITIEASSTRGAFYGAMSLVQIIYFSDIQNENYQLPECIISDAPRFAWRGYMLDESRHFYGKEKVLQTLDLMALHKLNKFHWHLTDAPGWRLEIKRYPLLTKVGAIGDHSHPDAPAQFYTQKDIREIITYAAARHIEVIPEVDMPGHASAAVLAYPEVSGGGSESHPNFTFNPGKEFTYQFLTDILTEVADLFPSKYIHIGGDEVHFGNREWSNDKGVQKIMEDNNYTDLKGVENYFIRRMSDTIKSLDKVMIGWDEIAQSDVDKSNSIMMWWRHDKPTILKEMVDNNYPVVLCPRVPMYFDFLQETDHKVGRNWNGIVDLQSVFHFPDNLNIDCDNSSVIGIQANMWTERTCTDESLDFLVWPRLSAMSVAGWTQSNNKKFNLFKKQLPDLYRLYESYGLYYYNSSDKSLHPEPEGVVESRWQERHR